MALFKDRLRELRMERSMTQEQLAVELDIPSASIRRWESSDEETIPRKERLSKICSFFGVSIDYLIGVSDTRFEDNAYTFAEKEATEFVIKELVTKYKIDLSDIKQRKKLEDLIRIVYDDQH